MMISQWGSMMDNLRDIYYLVRLIVHQVSIYLRDLILYNFFWMATNSDDFDSSDTKLRGLTFRNVTTDIVAFSVICFILFILVVLGSKCEKDEGQLYTPVGIETFVNYISKACNSLTKASPLPFAYLAVHRVSVDLPEDPFCVSNSSSIASNCFHACGDSICSRRRIPKRNFSEVDVCRVRSSNEQRTARIPKKSIFGLNSGQPQNSQSTQTTDKIFLKTTHTWLIRRTRSGHIYGKYPI